MTVRSHPVARSALEKAASGIEGLDEITGGGLPRARTTLVCGGAGTGKTLFGLQFLVRGALDYAEPGVLIAFEESASMLAENVASLGWDLDDLIERRLLAIDQVSLSPSEILESGEWDLDALILRLDAAIESVGARRVVLDTVEALFGVLRDERRLRSELRRLFAWLSERGVSAIVTGERGDGLLTRHGLEEYVSDCVVVLDNRLVDQIATRTLRIVKYRGSAHAPDECPFMIDERGFAVLPVTSMRLAHRVSTERVSLGIAELDRMLSGGPYRATTVLVTGTSGSGKTSLASSFLDAACARDERAILFTFEESPDQIVRNMASIGLDLERWRERGLLRIVATRPTAFGLEAHLALVHREVAEFEPRHVALDPATALGGEGFAVQAMLSRLVDHLKCQGVTAMFTALVRAAIESEAGLGVSSIVDTWIQLTNRERDAHREHAISVIKSRGMAHTTQLHPFLISGHGIEIKDASTRDGAAGGAAR